MQLTVNLPKEVNQMENMTLQQLVTSTQEALAESHASGYYQKVFKTVTRQFLLYAEEKGHWLLQH